MLSRNRVFLRRIFSTTTFASPPTNSLHLHLQSLRSLCANGHLSEAFSLFYSLDSPFHAASYSALFHACARHRQLRLGESLHCHLLHRHPNRPPNLVLDNHLVNMYAKCGRLEYAHQLFAEMPSRNIVSWTALLSGYSQYGRPLECFRVFADMLAHLHPTEYAYSTVLTSCGYNEGRQVHALTLKTCFDAYLYVSNALIAMYSNNVGHSSCTKDSVSDQKDEALAVFESMECHDLVSWNSLIEGFETHGRWMQAIEIFTQIHRDGIVFDRATLLSTISSLTAIDRDNVDLGLKYCYQLHCLSIRTGLIREVEVSTVLLKAYSYLGDNLYDCYRLFTDAGIYRDLVMWTEIIGTLASQNPQKALELFHQLRQEGFAADAYAILSALKACASLMDNQYTSSIHSLVVKTGFEGDILIGNALIHAYSRCGSLDMSKQIFKEMGIRDTVSWNSLLKAYGLHGQSRESLELFSQMNVQPDSSTFVSLLAACSHAGMVEEGGKIFNEMFQIHGVVPEIDHYACMIDLYGRAGLIQEAEKLVRTMPMEPDAVIWISLLGACRKHNETELAKLAFEKVRELDPDNSLGYVLLSNIYFSDGSFKEALVLRKEMTGSRVRKNPGLSWIGGGWDLNSVN